MEVVNKYTHRYLAQFIIESDTPLTLSSGEKDALSDSLVARDANGLPYIPATSLAGVFRNAVEKEYGAKIVENLFGTQDKAVVKGSEIIFTEAKILDSKGVPVDGLLVESKNSDSLLSHYESLPIRQHVRMNAAGVAERTGKFDEEYVYAGTRFCFEIEMLSDGSNFELFTNVLNQIFKSEFRIGGGTRKGFGKISVVGLKTMTLDLVDPEQLALYLDKTSSLKSDFWLSVEDRTVNDIKAGEEWAEYELTLAPKDFFLFSSGFGDVDEDLDVAIDIAPVYDRKVIWTNGRGECKDNMVLIPATSVKGALSHRVAYHWNKLNKYYAGNPNAKSGTENFAVRELFGYDGANEQKIGNVIISDVLLTPRSKDILLNHVSVDRFTGGALKGALFNEKVSSYSGEFTLTVLVNKKAFQEDKVKDAFLSALKDVCDGMLPLGGGVNRGHGVFKGTITCKDNI